MPLLRRRSRVRTRSRRSYRRGTHRNRKYPEENQEPEQGTRAADGQMAIKETDRVSTRPWAWAKAEELPRNQALFSATENVARFLASKAFDLVDKYSEQIQWWIDSSKAVIFISFIYSILIFNFFEAYLIMITGITLTSGFAFTFCICKKVMTTNFTHMARKIHKTIF